MRNCFITILLLLFGGTGYSQNDTSFLMNSNPDLDENPSIFSDFFLDNKDELLKMCPAVFKVFQENFIFPLELKDTLLLTLNTQKLYVYARMDIDTLGKIESINVLCYRFPLIEDYIKDIVLNYFPDLPSGIKGEKKVKIRLSVAMIISTEDKVKDRMQTICNTDRWCGWLYPIFKKEL